MEKRSSESQMPENQPSSTQIGFCPKKILLHFPQRKWRYIQVAKDNRYWM